MVEGRNHSVRNLDPVTVDGQALRFGHRRGAYLTGLLTRTVVGGTSGIRG